jgi:hypothetical protein
MIHQDVPRDQQDAAEVRRREGCFQLLPVISGRPSQGNESELSQVIKDVGGRLIVCVFIRAMHGHAVTLSTKAHRQ